MVDNRYLKILSYNIKGLGCDKYETIRDLLDKCDFLFLQEHWKYEKSFGEIISKEFPGYDCIISSPMNENIILQGRPYGGVGIICKNNINCKSQKVSTNSGRICAININIFSYDILLINVYLPCDTGSVHGENLDYTDVLDEIEMLVMSSEVDNIIIAGDFNADINRNNAQSKALTSFCTNENLFMCINNNNNSVPFTYTSNFGCKSTIDHFIITPNLKDYINRYETFSIHNNFSDHEPLYLELKICTDYVDVPKVSAVAKIDWDNCTNTDIEGYKRDIDMKLLKVNIKSEVFKCNNLKCNLHVTELNDIYEKVVLICDESSLRNLPNGCKKRTPGRIIPGWVDKIQPFRDKSLFWHDMWVTCGKPRQGEVARIYRMTKAKYHYAIRSAIKNEVNIRNENMANAIYLNCDRDLWREVKKISNCNKLLPNKIDDAIGSEKISKLFYSKNKDLFNSVGFKNKELIDLNEELERYICDDRYKSSNSIITVEDMKEAIKDLKSGKRDENGLYSDHFIHAPDRLIVVLTMLFNSMLVHGVAPSNLLIGTITPIIKNNRESHTISSNYRTLTIGTSFI